MNHSYKYWYYYSSYIRRWDDFVSAVDVGSGVGTSTTHFYPQIYNFGIDRHDLIFVFLSSSANHHP